ncbi:hypothetical protein HHI36_019396 [Cryptolaemus montrouzieri]|uniref:Uncharacterized protein n=1 Tax=Cryptolaemus montrouzieri TaxID=559131 RepID=A0ABD2P2S7_9CUCU
MRRRQMCQYVKLNGTCNSDGHCTCSMGTTCSTMGETCNLACKAVDMDGECDEITDICKCSAVPEICSPTECQESCQEDPRAKQCILVVAVGCLEYGPARFCECVCYQSGSKDVFKRYSKLSEKYHGIMVQRV